MNKLFIVACKTLGLLQLYWALSSLVFLGGALNTVKLVTVEEHNQILYLIMTILYCILSFAVAFLMIFKTERLARIVGLEKKDEIPHLPPQEMLIKTGIILIGIYFLLSSIPNLVKSIAALYLSIIRNGVLSILFYDRPNVDELVQTISIVCQIGLAILLIRKPDKVIRIISRKKKNA